MGLPSYWSRQRKFSRAERAITLHFTRHPGDDIIRVALRNRAAHDLILVPPGASAQDLFVLVRDYTRNLTRPEVRALQHHLKEGVGLPTLAA